MVYLLALILVLGIYLFVPTKKSGADANSKSSNEISYTLEAYLKDFQMKQADSAKSRINELLSRVEEAKDSLAKIQAFSSTIQYFNLLESPENSAWMVYKKAEFIKNANSWRICGDNFVQILMEGKYDTTLLKDISTHLMRSYENSLALDSTNLDTKVRLAQAYMELANEPMRGVPMLLEVTKKDSLHVQAQFLLAKFGLISGQYEKVMGRLEKVLSLQPENVEARLMRVDAQVELGNIEGAIKDLRKIEEMKKIPEAMRKEIASAIEDLDKKNKK